MTGRRSTHSPKASPQTASESARETRGATDSREPHQ